MDCRWSVRQRSYGAWSSAPAPDQAAVRGKARDRCSTCSIVIGEANKAITSFHDRSPFILTPDLYDPWLDRAVTDPDDVMKLLQPVPDDALAFHRVSTRVSSARNEGADLIEPIKAAQ